MTWAIWLAVPVVATLLAALWSWLRSRPRRLPDTAESMRAHSAYLDALGASARTLSANGVAEPAAQPAPSAQPRPGEPA